MPNPTPVLSVRISPSERDLLEAAADRSRTSISDFVRRKAIEAAEIDMIGQTIVTIPAKDWDRFEAWARAPAREVPALVELAEHRLPWRD